MRDKQTVLFKDKIRDYFARPRLYDLGVQISSHYISGIQVLPKEGKTRRHFVLPLEGGTINPSFNKKNITNSELLENKIKEGLKKIHISAHNIVFLLPELSQKTFIFNFDSFPSSQQEREHLIRFRANKQMPLLPDDIRLSFDIRKSNRSKKNSYNDCQIFCDKRIRKFIWQAPSESESSWDSVPECVEFA